MVRGSRGYGMQDRGHETRWWNFGHFLSRAVNRSRRATTSPMMSSASARFTRSLHQAMRAFATATALASSGVLVAGATTGCQGRCSDLYEAEQLDFEEASALPIRPRAAALGDGGRGLLVGDGGTILRQDMDGSWVDKGPGESADLYALTLRGDRAIAVGSGGTILVSDDGGDSWSPQESGTEATLRAITLLEGGGAVAVGDGVVVFSDNGEDVWSPAELPAGVDAELRAVGGTSTQVLAVGLAGVALMSSDNGQSWFEVARPTESDLLVVVGGSELVVLSRDGTQFLKGDGEWIWNGALEASVAAVDPGLGWVVHEDGTVGTINRVSFQGETPLPEGTEMPEVILSRGEESATLLGPNGERLEATINREWENYHSCLTYSGFEGRPFYVDGTARIAPVVDRDGWSEALLVDTHDLSPEAREALAEAWALDGAYEHASIASFARFVLDLMAVAAPASLIARAQAALGDEVRHAQACFDLATTYAGRPRGPGTFALDRAFAGEHDLISLGLSTFVEGCVNETIAAVEAEVAHSLAEIPLVRHTLAQIAADETRHAALAWDTLDWCLSVAGEPLHHALYEHYLAQCRQATAEAAIDADVDDDTDTKTSSMNLTRHGRLGEASRALIVANVRHSLILPRLAKILGLGRRDRARVVDPWERVASTPRSANV